MYSGDQRFNNFARRIVYFNIFTKTIFISVTRSEKQMALAFR